MENTVKAQREQILCDWRDFLSPDYFSLLVTQIDNLIELAREEGGLTPRAADGLTICQNCGSWLRAGECENCNSPIAPARR